MSGEGQAAVIIVLGGGVQGATLRRARKAKSLYRKGRAPRIILTGLPAEVEAMTGALKDVPTGAITREERAKDTIGNAVFTKPLVSEARKVIVVTSDYHLKRALYVFRHVYGEEYAITGAAARTPPHILFFQRPDRHERQSMTLDQAFFLDLAPGDDHSLARRLRLHPLYQ